MKRFFGPEGLLAQNIPSFEFRDLQLKMAEAIADSLENGTSLLVEAGTGTGKTWAYLIPSILSGKKVVISTGTKTLQDQIFDHDIPLLKRLFFPKLKAVCIKGRRNYLCKRRLREFAYQPSLWNKQEAKLFVRLQKWAVRTNVGDRAEISWLPDHFQSWNEICSSREQCLGPQCEDHSRCFLTLLRQRASRADLLVVNHYLFFADLAVQKMGFGEIIPEHEAVIFDEAHQLEDIIASYFGIQLSNFKLYELTQDTLKEFRKESKQTRKFQEIHKLIQHVDVLSRQLYQKLSSRSPGTSQGRFPLDLEELGKDFAEVCRVLLHTLEQLGASLNSYLDIYPSLELCKRRALEMVESFQVLLSQQDASLVYWYELTSQGFFMNGTPIEIAPILQEHLFTRTSSVIMTSATLSAAGSFSFLRERLGIPPESKESIFLSPFSFKEQALLYIPNPFPEPKEPVFCDCVAKAALEILTKTHGRALFLFTSYQNLRQVHGHLKDRLPFPLLVQGQKPKRVLLSEFKERIESVLLATNSFWQGIDVPGEALSCVIIDKLPFDVPDDPLTAARMERLAQQGKSPFFHYQIPRAVIHLKQGIGRLLRSSRDRGIVVIFDVRLLTKNYGRLFLKSLPPYRMVHRIESLDHFLNSSEIHFQDIERNSGKVSS